MPKMNLENIKLENIIPQKAPFTMIDCLVEHSNKSATSTLQIKGSNVLVENNSFSAAGILENMAQTAAAQLGYEAFLKNLDAPLGFIAAVKNFSIIENPVVDTQIKTKIEYISTIINIHIVNAVTYFNDKEIASAELRIFIKE